MLALLIGAVNITSTFPSFNAFEQLDNEMKESSPAVLSSTPKLIL